MIRDVLTGSWLFRVLWNARSAMHWKNLIMYALYAVTTKANRSSARLLKNNRKTFSSRGKRFFSVWNRGEVMKKKVLKVLAVRVSFFWTYPQRFFQWKERWIPGDMRWQLLESEGPLKPETLLRPVCVCGTPSPTSGGQSWGKSSLLHPARRRQAFLLSIFHMVSILKICYNYRKFNAEICSLWLLEG